MGNYRNTRINEGTSQVISEALRNVKDPRVASQFITVTHCSVSADLKFAKVYFSLFDNSEDNIKETMKGLKSATGYIRSQLARNLNLRITPELSFVYDDGAVQSTKINEILKTINSEKKEENTNEENG